jgi:hypothetical protein
LLRLQSLLQQTVAQPQGLRRALLLVPQWGALLGLRSAQESAGPPVALRPARTVMS